MFSRKTIFKLIESFNFQNHAAIDRFALLFGFEDIIEGTTVKGKETSILRHIIRNPDITTPDGEPLIAAIITRLLSESDEQVDPSDKFPELVNSLERDGYLLTQSGLRTRLPEEIPITMQENELIELLNTYNYNVAKGHYEQAVSAHTRGDWAAANSQLRSFVEEFFNRVTDEITPGSYTSSHNRREALARVGFFKTELNEWLNNGKGFVPGFWSRLHPEGSHPGLSEREDSTFRLHLVIIVMLYFAKRIEQFHEK